MARQICDVFDKRIIASRNTIRDKLATIPMRIKKSDFARELTSWLGTPYHAQSKKKGIGADCAGLLVGVANNLNIIPEIELKRFPCFWHHFPNPEYYLEKIEEFTNELKIEEKKEKIQTGDIVTFKIGKVVAHAGIILEMPIFIHAIENTGVTKGSLLESYWKKRIHKFYRFKGLEIWDDE